MRPPTSTSLYVRLDPDRAAAVGVAAWEADGLRLEVADAGRAIRWGRSLTAVRRAGRWTRRGDGGACTVDLVPAGAGRTLVVLTLEPSPRRLASAPTTEVCWAAASRLRDVLEGGGAAPRTTADALARPATSPENGSEACPPQPVASGILPA